jgi:hypothetical protein
MSTGCTEKGSIENRLRETVTRGALGRAGGGGGSVEIIVCERMGCHSCDLGLLFRKWACGGFLESWGRETDRGRGDKERETFIDNQQVTCGR